MNIENLYELFKNSSGITTDTRKIEKDNLFFALKGDKFDANTFALQALVQGASYAIVDDKSLSDQKNCIYVESVLLTLQNLANYHRKQFNIPVIGLTGSNGKTTNKELLVRVLSSKFKVHATKGNLNNHIGVPLTLLSMPLDTQMAVIEMGANHQKEIEILSNICEPTHGFITNIGKAHLEGFGGIEGVKKGKGELYDFLIKSGGTAFIHTLDSTLMEISKEKKMNLIVYYGNDDRALQLLSETPVVKFKTPDNETVYTSHIGGKYNFDNMQTAYNIGRFFGINSADAAEALASYNPDNNRSQVIEKGSNFYLMDAYNANPSSMAASVNNFGNLETPFKKVVILGDMFELGEYSQQEHENLGKLVSEKNFDFVVLYGENMKYALIHLPKAYYFTDKFSLHNWLVDSGFTNTWFLVKGSRGVGLESILGVMN